MRDGQAQTSSPRVPGSGHVEPDERLKHAFGVGGVDPETRASPGSDRAHARPDRALSPTWISRTGRPASITGMVNTRTDSPWVSSPVS
jgi:hypothetical protein